MEDKKRISVDELLKRKKERNEKKDEANRINFKNRNKQIAIRHKENTKDNLLGEAQIDLQKQLLDAEYEAVSEVEAEYNLMTNQVLASLDTEADEKAGLISSAEDVVFDVDYKVVEALPELPPRKSRFGNRLLGGNPKSLLSLSEKETKVIEGKSDNPYASKKKPS